MTYHYSNIKQVPLKSTSTSSPKQDYSDYLKASPDSFRKLCQMLESVDVFSPKLYVPCQPLGSYESDEEAPFLLDTMDNQQRAIDGNRKVERCLLNFFYTAHLPFESDNIMHDIVDVMDQISKVQRRLGNNVDNITEKDRLVDNVENIIEKDRLVDNVDNIIDSTVLLDEPLHPNEVLEIQSQFRSDSIIIEEALLNEFGVGQVWYDGTDTAAPHVYWVRIERHLSLLVSVTITPVEC